MRRSFASPFVLTVAACGGRVYDNPPPPRHPPADTDKTAPTTPTTPIANPPRPTTGGREIQWVVTMQGGKCTAVEKCLVKPHETPPPNCQPRAAKCPPLASEGASVEVHQSADGACYQIPGHVDCPPTASCNPPPPSKVDCP